jgi:hypothetical protein
MLNKTTLKTLSEAATAIGAALIALGQELQGDGGDAAPVETTTQKTTRRGKGTTEPPPAGDGAPAATGPTAEEVKASFQPLVEAGHAVKVKEVLAKFGGVTKIADLAVEHYPAFIAAIKKLKADIEADL